MSDTYKLVWHASQTDCHAIDACISELLAPPADAVSLEKQDATLADEACDWTLSAYFTDAPTPQEIHSFLNKMGVQVPLPALERVPDKDWVAHALEGLGIVEAGRFILYGIHDAGNITQKANDIPIRIDANQAFGTGHHPTTAGCLSVLDQLGPLSPQNILDLGTGSAVLAIAAAKTWGVPILASDIDQTSIQIAQHNAKLNNVSQIDFIVADGFHHSAFQERQPFDLIFANILAGPLAALAQDMANHTSPGGILILAGMLDEQAQGVYAAYEAVGFQVKHQLMQVTWPVCVLEKANDLQK